MSTAEIAFEYSTLRHVGRCDQPQRVGRSPEACRTNVPNDFKRKGVSIRPLAKDTTHCPACFLQLSLSPPLTAVDIKSTIGP